MADKKKFSRVQGSWASQSNSTQATASVSSVKTSTTTPPITTQLSYKEDENAIKQRPADINITEDGTYELSTSANGVSKIRLIRNFFDEKDADWIFEQLRDELPWEKRINKKYNTEEPRLSCWIGEHPYIYSGVEWAPLPFTPITEMIRDRLEQTLNYRFNSVLANLYRDGKDAISWHSDDEPMLRKHPFIGSISLGDLRMFELRRKLDLSTTPNDSKEYDYVQHVRIPLTHGSLLVMEGATQDDWQHQVPREYHDRGPRINLTYRTIFPSN